MIDFPEDDFDSNVDNDVQAEVKSILSVWSKNINVDSSEDVANRVNDDDMRNTVQNLVQDLSPKKKTISSTFSGKRFSDGRRWKSAIPPKNSSPNNSPSPQKRKIRKRYSKKKPKEYNRGVRTQPPKPKPSRPTPLFHQTVKSKPKKNPNFLLTSTSFHKKNENIEIPRTTNLKNRRKRKKKRAKKRKKPLLNRVLDPERGNTNLPPRIQQLQKSYDRMSEGTYDRIEISPPPVIDSSLHESLQKRVNHLRTQLEETVRDPLYINDFPRGNLNNQVTPNRELPSIIGDGNIQYEAQQARQEELERELSRVRTELLKQKQEKVSATNELKVLEIEKEKRRLQDAIKEREARENKAFEEVQTYRNTRLIIRYFSRWRHHFNQKKPESTRKTSNSNEFKVKIGVIFEWKLKRRIFRKYRNIVQHVREEREKKKMRERLRQDQAKISMIKRGRRIKILTKMFQKWRFKTKMKEAERGFQKEREILAKQRSMFMSRFRSKLVGEEQKEQNDIYIEKKRKKGRRTNNSNFLITNLSGEERKRKELNSSKEDDDDELFLEKKKVKRIRNLKSTEDDDDDDDDPDNLEINNENQEEEDNNNEKSIPRITEKGKQKKKKKRMKKKKNKRPLFVKTMEERLKQRKENWKKLKEKYREQDQERIKHEEKEQQKKEEEEKEKKREVRMKKKQAEAKKKARVLERKKKKEVYLKKIEKADIKRKELLLRYYGWNNWKKFIEKRREISKDSERFFLQKLKMKVFIGWRNWVGEIREEKKKEDQRKIEVFEGVVDLRRKKHALRTWRRRLKDHKDALKKYDLLHQKSIRRKFLKKWYDALITKEKRRKNFLENIENDVQLMKRKVTLRYYFKKLLRMMEIVRENKEKEELGKELRFKVDSWITEFRLKRNFNWDI